MSGSFKVDVVDDVEDDDDVVVDAVSFRSSAGGEVEKHALCTTRCKVRTNGVLGSIPLVWRARTVDVYMRFRIA